MAERKKVLDRIRQEGKSSGFYLMNLNKPGLVIGSTVRRRSEESRQLIAGAKKKTNENFRHGTEGKRL